MVKKLLFIAFLFFGFPSFSQLPQLSEQSTVSVFTCGRGDQLYSTFGHTAIRIKDAANLVDVVYNYGAFDFRTENFYLKFLKGDLQYFMNITSYEEFIYEYQYDNREVIEQTLNLNIHQKQLLYERLYLSSSSEDKFYTYKFIDQNCTTMVADKLELITKKPIPKVGDTSISYRTVLYPYFEDYFWYKLGINIIFGKRTDEKAEQLFLPVELMESLDKTAFEGKPLVLKKEVIVKGSEPNLPFSFFNSIYLIIALLALLLISNKRTLFLSYLFILGLMGVFLSFVGLYSFHKEVLWNYNALLFNPVFLLLPFVNVNWSKKLIFFCWIVLVIYLIIMLSKPHLVLMLPFIVANAYILGKLYRKKKQLLPSVKQHRT